MIDDRFLKKIISKVASDLGIPRLLVDHVFNYEMKYVRQIMDSGTNESVRLKYLGIFGVKAKRLMYDKNYYKGPEMRKEHNIITKSQLKREKNAERKKRRADNKL